ncbi:hypothetical protein KKH27_02150 [bacterium]|nr:hypothetical protein [bacterium]MBU1985009.1 hypothetical protein [bacterium]
MNLFPRFIPLILLLVTLSGRAATVVVDSAGPFRAQVELISQEPHDLVIELRIGSVQVDSLQVAGRLWTAISIAGMGLASESGMPELPQHSLWLRVASTEPELSIIEDQTARFEWAAIQPAPEVMNRLPEVEIRRIPDPAAYRATTVYPESPVTVTVRGDVGKSRVALLTFHPVQYRARTQDYVVHTRLRVRLSGRERGSLDQSVGVPRATRDLLARLVLNPAPDETTDVPVSPRLLIFTEPQFVSALQPFVEWKRRSGLPVRTVIYSEVASGAASLQAFIRRFADSLDTPPEFVLIVGDVDVIPPFYGVAGSLTDHPYSLLTNTDYLPDLSVGRIPCQNVQGCSDWVQRVLSYERDAVTASHTGSVFASAHALDPQHGIYVRSLFERRGMTVDRLQQPESSALSLLLGSLNAGRQWVFYIGHGYSQAWSSVQPYFTNTSVGQVTAESTPIVISVACETADLDYPGMSIAEYWLARQGHRGPLAYFGATESTAFFRSDTIGIGALRAIFESGCDRLGIAADLGRFECVQCFPQAPGGLTEETVQQFILLGDPSLRVFTAQPLALNVLFPSVVHASEDGFTVSVSQDNRPLRNATVCVSGDSTSFYRVLQTDVNGMVRCSNLPTDPCRLRVVVTAANSVPYQGSITVVSGSAPFLSVVGLRVFDEAGDDDGHADRSESCELRISVVNRGRTPSQSGTADILPPQCLDFSTLSLALPVVAGGDTVNLDPVSVTVCDSASDQSVAMIRIRFRQLGDTTEDVVPLTLHAPLMEYRGREVEVDTAESGELVLSTDLRFTNSGSDRAVALSCSLLSLPSEIQFVRMEPPVAIAMPGDTMEFTALLSAASTLPRGFPLSFGYRISGTNVPAQTGSDVLRVGQVPVYLYEVDLIPQQVDGVAAALTSLGIEFERGDVLPQDLFRFTSVWVFCGTCPNAWPLPSVDASRLAGYLDGGGQCYLEGGDFWAYDTPTSLHPYFRINGLSDGSSNAGPVVGRESTLCRGMRFEYVGENNFIDQLAPGDGAEVWLRNNRTGAGYAVCIAYDGGSYRTVGSSIELGALADSLFPSTRVNLFHAIAQWFGIVSRTDVFPPVIEHTPVTVYTRPNFPIPIGADIQDASGVASAEIEYRRNGGASQTALMSLQDGVYTGELAGAPFGFVISYRIRATDASTNANTTATAEYSLRIVARPNLCLHTQFNTSHRVQLIPRVQAGEGCSWSVTNYPEDVPVLELHGRRGNAISYTTEAFDCSSLQSVQLAFGHYLREATPAEGTLARVLGSTDGGVTFPYTAWEKEQRGGGVLLEGNTVISELAWAAGQSNVVLKFEYLGNWYWRLRDIIVAGTTVPIFAPIRDLTISPAPPGVLLLWGAVPGVVRYDVLGTIGERRDSGWEVIARTNDTLFHDVDIPFTVRYYTVRGVIEESIPPPGWAIPLNPVLGNGQLRMPDLIWNRKLGAVNPR